MLQALHNWVSVSSLSSSSTFSIAQSPPATLSVILFYRFTKDTFTPGPLYLLVSLPKLSFPDSQFHWLPFEFCSIATWIRFRKFRLLQPLPPTHTHMLVFSLYLLTLIQIHVFLLTWIFISGAVHFIEYHVSSISDISR